MPKVYFPILAAFLEVVVMQLYNMSTNHTVLKIKNFSATEILCEINFANLSHENCHFDGFIRSEF